MEKLFTSNLSTIALCVLHTCRISFFVLSNYCQTQKRARTRRAATTASACAVGACVAQGGWGTTAPSSTTRSSTASRTARPTASSTSTPASASVTAGGPAPTALTVSHPVFKYQNLKQLKYYEMKKSLVQNGKNRRSDVKGMKLRKYQEKYNSSSEEMVTPF